MSTRGHGPPGGGHGQRRRPHGLALDVDLAEAEPPHPVAGGVGERVGGQGLGLDGAAGRVDQAVEDDEDAEAAHGGGDLERVVEVPGPVAVAGAEGPLGAGEDDGARVGVVEVQEERGLLQRVGPVRDDDAVDAGVGERLLDRAQQRELAVGGHPGAVDVEEVEDLDVHGVGNGRGGDDVVTGGVGGVSAARPAARDGAAGADHHDAARPGVARPLHDLTPLSLRRRRNDRPIGTQGDCDFYPES
ncbi:hypothetical protein GCM10019017_03770 [Streptomyces showdoensis]